MRLQSYKLGQRWECGRMHGGGWQAASWAIRCRCMAMMRWQVGGARHSSEGTPARPAATHRSASIYHGQAYTIMCMDAAAAASQLHMRSAASQQAHFYISLRQLICCLLSPPPPPSIIIIDLPQPVSCTNLTSPRHSLLIPNLPSSSRSAPTRHYRRTA